MNLIDSSGWLEYFTDGKCAKHYAPVIENTEDIIVSALNLYEVFKKILKEANEDSAKEAIGIMIQSQVIEVNISIALSAAKLSTDLKIPMADSIIYATARTYNAVVWTQDHDFADLPGVKFIKK